MTTAPSRPVPRTLPAILAVLVVCFGSTRSPAQHTWFPSLQVPGNVPGTSLGFHAVSYNPLRPATIYAGGDKLYVSYDAGDHWNVLWGETSADIRFIAVNPADTLMMFVGQRYDLYRTTDGGGSWNPVLQNISYDGESIAIDTASPNLMYTGGVKGGFHRSTDSGASWTLSAGTQTLGYCTVVIRPDSTNVLLAGSGDGTISKSVDHGATWYVVHTSGSGETPKIVIDHVNPMTAYAIHVDGVGGVWKTTDGGETWGSGGLDGISLWSLDIDPNDTQTLYTGEFGSGPGRMFRTTNGGGTWTEDNFSFPLNALHWMVKVVPTDSMLAFAAFDGSDNTAFWFGGLYRLDPGNTFRIDIGSKDLRYPTASSGDTVSLAFPVHNGPLQTTIDSITSRFFTYRLTPEKPVFAPLSDDTIRMSLVYPPSPGSDTLFVWSADIKDNPKRISVVVETVLGAAVTDQVPDRFVLEQNFPNPFNPTTGIMFQTTDNGHVRLVVFDVLGREIARPVDGVMSAGQHRITWEAAAYASGIYIARLESGEHVRTIRMMLVR